MSGVMFAMGPCIVCKRVFSFHPDLVPSVRPTPDDPREPVCATCIARANDWREKNGEPLIPVPPGAYEPGEA